MRIVHLLSLAAAAAVLPVLSTSSTAQTTEEVQAPSTEGERLLEGFFSELYGRNYDSALRTASKFQVGDTKEGRAMQMAMRAAALMGLKKTAEARRLFAEADRLWPTEPFVSWLQFESASLADQNDVAGAALDTMIARFPDKVREIDQEWMWYFLRNEPKDQQQQNEDRRIALARIGYGGSEGDYLSLEAVRFLLKRGDAASAAELIQYIDEPQLIEDMLVQKRYSALWPPLEAMAGPRLEKVRLKSVAAAKRAYEEDPDNFERLQILINALRHAGHLDDAIALRSKLPATNEAMSAATEQMGWAINNVALALHEADRADDADALFASLNNAKIDKARWRVSMVINRLELLVADGKFARAVELLPVTETTAAADGSPYARQLVRRLKYCTLSGLGRKEEAAKVLPAMIEHAKDAYHATVDGLLCAGETDQAEKLVLTAISDDHFQEQFVRAVQPVALTSDDPSIWDDRWKALRQRPAAAKEFERLGRDMPAQFLPADRPKSNSA